MKKKWYEMTEDEALRDMIANGTHRNNVKKKACKHKWHFYIGPPKSYHLGWGFTKEYLTENAICQKCLKKIKL